MIDEINSSQESAINQTDYLKLFMQELTYQDPLKPVDNREFMAQMAQFSSLQEARATNDKLDSLDGMTSANQAITLLGKRVKVDGSSEWGQVTEVQFPAKAPPLLVININGGSVKKELREVQQIHN